MTVTKNNPPPHSWWSACEVLTWITFGKAKTHEELLDDDFLFKWRTTNGEALLRAMCALAGKGLDGNPAAPCCPLEVDMIGGPRNVQAFIERLTAERGMSVEALASDLETDMAQLASDNTKIEAAKAELVEAIRAERIEAWGRPAESVGKARRGAAHERVAPSLFLRPLEVELWNTIQPDSSHPDFWGEDWDGYHFSEIRFKRAEVLRVWPESARDPTATSTGNAATGAFDIPRTEILTLGPAGTRQFPAYNHRPPTQRQNACQALLTLYGSDGPPEMKREALLAEVNQHLVQQGHSPVSRKTLLRALQGDGPK